MQSIVALVGVFGLLLDVAFHWVDAVFSAGAVIARPAVAIGFFEVMRNLLIDEDPSLVPLWVTLLGISAHMLFLGGFGLLVALGLIPAIRQRSS